MELQLENSEEFVTNMARKLARTAKGKGGLFLERLTKEGCSDNVLQEILKHLPYEKFHEVQQSVEAGI
jgi:hypothetical protein